jgi:hypothetical protein
VARPYVAKLLLLGSSSQGEEQLFWPDPE